MSTRFGNSTSGMSAASQAAILEMVVDPDKYRERILELKEQEAALDEKIKVVGEVDQIHAIRLATEEANAAAAEKLRQTEEDCAKMRQEAADHVASVDLQCETKLAEHKKQLDEERAVLKADIEYQISANQKVCKACLEDADLILQDARQQAANTEQECATRKKAIENYLSECIAFMDSQAEMVTTMVQNYKAELEAQRQRLVLIQTS